jgi:AraC-type DNA-binding domain-containing proteins
LPLTLDDLAAELFVDKVYLERVYKKATGKTILESWRHRRIEVPMKMLCFSNVSIMEIAERLCFCSQSHFGKCFKEILGVMPRDYRKSSVASTDKK